MSPSNRKTSLHSFLNKALPYLEKPGFLSHEIEPKLRAAGEFRVANEAYRKQSVSAYQKLKGALQNQNFVDWRAYDLLLKFGDKQGPVLAKALRRLWNDSTNLSQRLNEFAHVLSAAGVEQTGSQLSIMSLLLSGASGKDYPHVVTNAFNHAFQVAGHPQFDSSQNAAARYVHSLEFFDLLVREGESLGVPIRDRLEARAVAWCVGQGVDPDYYATTLTHGTASEMDQAEAVSLIGESARGKTLSATEVEALIKSRLGQGKFRSDLLEAWGKCCVTGCRNIALLRAAHVKPWKDSTNAERLSPDNGLLLSPNLDSAFDRGLIAFKDNGAIMVSHNLSTADATCLGLSAKMRLEYVRREQMPYLAYHRKHRFQRKTKTT